MKLMFDKHNIFLPIDISDLCSNDNDNRHDMCDIYLSIQIIGVCLVLYSMSATVNNLYDDSEYC